MESRTRTKQASPTRTLPRMDSKTVTRASVIAIIALLVPMGFKLSAVTVLLLSPLILLGLVFAFIAANLALGYYADRARGFRNPPNPLAHAARPLAFSTPAAWQAVQTRSQWSASSVVLPPLVPSYPRVSLALNGILSWIIRDFVWVWYRAISSHTAFPSTVERTIHTSLSALATRAEKLDLPALVVRRVLPLITAHIEHFRQSEVALRGTGLERHLTHSEELDLLLASRYAGRGKLHPAVDNLASMVTKQGEDAHMRRLVDRALPLLVPQQELQSTAVRIVAREIVACAVFGPIVEMLSDPDFWNRIIDQTATAAIRQQKLISRVRDILVAESTAPNGAQIERISVRTDAVHFDAFLRSIRRSNSLLDARRLKNDIAGEIRKTRLLLANNDKGDWIDGEKTEHVVAYLDRLYTAKRAVDERISVLSGSTGESGHRQSTFAEAGAPPENFPVLRTVLAHPGSLGYFMEFMDRRSRSVLVQFWLAVESFKNPLEDADAESGPESGPEDEVSEAEAQTLREDMHMLLAQYLAPRAMPVPVSVRHIERIKTFAQGTGVHGERKARRAVVKVQAEVEKAMAHDFEEFAISDLGFRARADLDRTLHAQRQDQPALPPAHAALPAHSQLSRRATVPKIDLPSTKSAPANLEFLIASPSAEEDERPPLFSEEPDSPEAVQARRMEAISAALEDIIAEDNSSMRSAGGASSTRRRRRGGLFGDDERLPAVAEDLEDAVEAAEEAEQEEVQLAGPGDLQLEDDIARLTTKLEELRAQDALLAALVRKAELTGDEAELKLLRKSQSALARELRAREFQKTQFETQAKENKLVPGRTRVSISSTSTGEETGEGQVVRYIVEVQQLDERGTGAVASGWVVARRYNDFWAMHHKLRERYVAVRSMDFPGKRLVGMITPAFVDARRAGLEKYLQSLIAVPALCESDELRAFLSRQDSAATNGATSMTASSPGPLAANFMRTMYRSVAGSLDDMIFGPSMLDVMLQRLVRQAAARAGIVGAGAGDESLVARSVAPEALVGESEGGETAAGGFSAAICDLILAVFELNKENNWLRRQAVVVILQQVLGGTIERRIRDMTRTYLDEDHVLGYLNTFQNNLWPGGVLKPPSIPRSAEEKAETKEAAHRKLSTLMPDIAANMIGRSNARKGARRIFNVMQNRRLNQHIIYLVIDEVFSALFPDA
ncbi:hypothetical protein EXIGLDRAFT_651692 [Exidia glandulosa HHB12029]|uniref:PhoX domain-containing protein n=1 Tax=Exidia glandulosa HHB12029 TaxID=1314781 RepID=A0A165EYU6_EXIGL|nr:hypothetical protein EXIGLDRAFT_651692 [Exidia glandulosa HHB12029]